MPDDAVDAPAVPLRRPQQLRHHQPVGDREGLGAGLIIRATCDTVFALLAHELDIAVPPFQQRAQLVLDVLPLKKPAGGSSASAW